MISIQVATVADWPEIEAIYRQGIRTGQATFAREEEIPDGESWFDGKIDGLTFKAVDVDGTMLGWVTVSQVSKRAVYKGVAESSIYIASDAQGRGVGSQLMTHMIEATEQRGIWTLIAGVFPENSASLRLHQKFGYRILGIREKLGQMDGVWRDVAYLERRSATVM